MKSTRLGRGIGILAVAAVALVPVAIASAAFAADPGTQSTANVGNGDELIEQWAITNNTVITLTDNITIDTCEGDPFRDTGGSGIVIDGQGLYGITQTCDFTRVLLDNGDEHVTLTGLTHFEGGYACGAGGGLYTNGSATVENSTINDNVATEQGACEKAVESDPVGGGVYTDDGNVEVINSAFSGNHADDAGGGFAAVGSTMVTNSSFNENSAGLSGDNGDEFFGGGFATQGVANVSGSTFTGNFIGEFDGQSGLCENCFATGGGFWAGDGSTVSGSTFNGNHADCDGDCSSAGGAISDDEELTISGSAFNENSTDCGGGCTATGGATYSPSTDVEGSSFDGNVATCSGECGNYGGAISTAGFDVALSRFTGNHADCEDQCAAYGGAIAAVEIGSGSAGIKSFGPGVQSFATDGWGGVGPSAFAVAPGEGTISQSTFSGNVATSDGGNCGCSGGAVLLEEPQSLTVDASTFDHNVALYDGGAVAIYADGDPPVSITNSTVTQNTSGSSGALALNAGPAHLAYDTIVQNMIVAPPIDDLADGDTAANITASEPVFFGTIVALPIGGINCDVAGESSQGYNFSDDTTCGLDQATDKVATPNDPGLGALGSNGGSTETMLPQTGSPVIDAIPVAACQTGIAAGITIDQRDVTRPQGPGCDIGAVEVEFVAPAPTPSPALVITPKFTG